MRAIDRKEEFITSSAGIESADTLKEMVLDPTYNTLPSYSTKIDLYPNNLMPFFDKHMKYLSEHTDINHELYLSNLRLMTRIRVSSPIE